jgi:hypothetical protein
VGLANLGSESETCVGSRVRLVEVSISFKKNFYQLPFTPPSLVRCIDPSSCFWPAEVWQIVRLDVADRPRGTGCLRTVRYSTCASGGSTFIFGPSIRDPRTVHLYHANCPPSHHGLSASCLAELLSSLLLEFRFRFRIVWGSLLGLVSPL